MKKLLVLILVLVLTSVANSALILQISVNGSTAIADSQITIQPSDTLELDIYCANYYPCDIGVYVALVVDTMYGTISGGVVQIPPAPLWSSMQGQSAAGDGFPGLNPGEDGPYAALVGGPTCETDEPGTYINQFVFHCELQGDAIIRLVTTDGDFFVGTELNRVTIHQVAEPDCLIGGNAGTKEYSDWVAWGKPNCWCYCRQCRGDTDGKKTGTKWVALSDLTAFSAAYDKTDAVLATIPNGICCDLDHKKAGVNRVALSDLIILATYYDKAPVPRCDAAPIITGPYNFWCDATGCNITCP